MMEECKYDWVEKHKIVFEGNLVDIEVEVDTETISNGRYPMKVVVVGYFPPKEFAKFMEDIIKNEELNEDEPFKDIKWRFEFTRFHYEEVD